MCERHACEWTYVRTYVCTSERTCERTCERTSVRLHGHSPRARARTKIRSTWVDLIFARPCLFSIDLVWFSIVALCTYRNKVDWESTLFSYVHAHAASERANARTYAHTSVHLYAHVRSLVRSHVHSSVHSFALRSSPRPLATRTPYVHRVSWSFKSIVYEALKKAKLYIYIYIYIIITLILYIYIQYIYIYKQ